MAKEEGRKRRNFRGLVVTSAQLWFTPGRSRTVACMKRPYLVVGETTVMLLTLSLHRY